MASVRFVASSSRRTASCPATRSARSSSSACARRAPSCSCPPGAGRPAARTARGSSGSRPPRIQRETASWRSAAAAGTLRSRRTRPCPLGTSARRSTRRRTRRTCRSSESASSGRTWCTVPPGTSTPFSSCGSERHDKINLSRKIVLG
ncbi:hypothetical protein PUN28_005407 [Cardiocondyla obscurior]|uniref:Uncharacterized protein n=1 Tax=Cardiocondyla obscurior TaxID=286306 RepID=A0AAW2GHP3_9HYME